MARFLLSVIMLLAVSSTATARPFGDGMSLAPSTDALIADIICSSTGLECFDNAMFTDSAESDITKAANLRDMSISTINELQRDFFVESALVAGGIMHLDQNLRDPAPKMAFLSSAAAKALPALTSSNALSLMKSFGVAVESTTATAIATAAHLCGSAALPGEARACAASTEAVAAFVVKELGHKAIQIFATSGAPTSIPAAKAPVTVVDVAMGSAAEGATIVVCHHLAFPTALYYCHRVNGTKVAKATLDSGSGLIKAVAVCHIDTSLWLSTHPAFAALKIPRGDEACHFLVQNDLIFVSACA